MNDFFLFFKKNIFSCYLYNNYSQNSHRLGHLGLTCHLSFNICVDYSHFLLQDLKGPGIDFTVPCQVPARISSALSHADETVTPSEAAAKHPHLQTEIKS